MKLNKLHAIFLCFLTPGLLLSWVCLIFPFYLWDSLSEDWYPVFMEDAKLVFKGIKNKWEGK